MTDTLLQDYRAFVVGRDGHVKAGTIFGAPTTRRQKRALCIWEAVRILNCGAALEGLPSIKLLSPIGNISNGLPYTTGAHQARVKEQAAEMQANSASTRRSWLISIPSSPGSASRCTLQVVRDALSGIVCDLKGHVGDSTTAL